MKIYLDNCCYNRPFDDQTQPRIHLESEAVLIILSRAQQKKDIILGSPILEFEMARMTDLVKKLRVKELYKIADRKSAYTDRVRARAQEIQKQSKIRLLDSLHIATAEEADADVLVTTDDRLIKMASRIELGVRVMNPLTFLKEVF